MGNSQDDETFESTLPKETIECWSWYLFEHSYLMSIAVDPAACTLQLDIDAKMTFEHPKAAFVQGIEDNFERMGIKLEEVTFLKMSSNPRQLLHNPNEDIGSIDQLVIQRDHEEYSFFVKFVSEAISFETGCGKVVIV